MRKISYKEISNRIFEAELPDFDCVIGIGSSGVIPAAAIAFRTHTDLFIVNISYRDEAHQPLYDHPRVLHPFYLDKSYYSLIIVDDVSITGETILTAKKLFPQHPITTLVLCGEADYVLFPEIQEDIIWPWSYSRIKLDAKKINA